MPNECSRKFSHCDHNGHNSRTCTKGCTAGFKLFGVQIDVSGEDGGESSIKKSKSVGNLDTSNGENMAGEASGYLSDGLVHASSRLRKKGKSWSEDEHRSFLMGLEKLGKGDWKGISNNFVPSRNSSQVASHAQKYFNRLASTERKRRRTSVFDIPLHDVDQLSQVVPSSQSSKAAESSEPASVQATAATSERPPLSSMRKRGVPDLRSIVYMRRVSSFSQGFSGQAGMPTMSWVSVGNLSGHSSSAFHLPNYIHGALGGCAPFVPQPAVATMRQSVQKKGSLAQAAAMMNKNDAFNLNIRELKL